MSSVSPVSLGVEVLLMQCSVLLRKWACRGGCLGWDQIGTGGVASCKLEEALPDNDPCLH